MSSTTIASRTEESASAPDPALIRIRDLIYKNCGIFMPDNKFYFLKDRCARRLKQLNADSLRTYYDILTISSDRDAEVRNLLNEITVGETCFFRSPQQLSAIEKIVLPHVMAAKEKMGYKRLKIWSAASSTGEEPYTISMMLLELAATVLKGWTWEITATDLNDNSIARAGKGLFDEYALRNTPATYRKKYFEARDKECAIAEAVKKNVVFRRLNLLDESKMLFMKGFDIVFCANCLIYFDGASKRQTVQHFFNSLVPGGYFFMGHSESLYGVNEKFHLVHFTGATAYMRPVIEGGGAR